MTSSKTNVKFKKGDYTCQLGQEYLSLVYDVLVLFMFSLMADWTRVSYKTVLQIDFVGVSSKPCLLPFLVTDRF